MSKITILGAGESGVGAALLAKKKRQNVFVSDFGTIKQKYKDELIQNNIKWEEQTHTYDLILDADLIIKSPGIPDTADIIVKAIEKNIPVISEIEYAGKYNKAKTICITGSNGKTTTTMLTHHILKLAGYNVGMAGNIGFSFARQVAENAHDVYVLELSSFQLDGMNDFRADISVITNITPDHLDRYDNKMENYINSKFRIVNNQSKRQVFLLNADDNILFENIKEKNSEVGLLIYTIKNITLHGAYLENDLIKLYDESSISVNDIALKGKHGLYNSMSALLACKKLGLNNEQISKGLSTFTGVEHRQELVKELNGVSYINDSKATNVDSTWYALDAIEKNIILIIGGVDKGNDYSQIETLVKQRVKALICLGTDNSKLHKAFDHVVNNIVDTNSMQDAINKANQISESGDTVLLSPACASFDLFTNYEHRGNEFKKYVNQL